MTTTLEKVQRLINLTASDNVNEAKTAALQACRIIREKKLVIREPREERIPTRIPDPPAGSPFRRYDPPPPPPPPPVRPDPGRAPPGVDFSDFRGDLNDYLRDFETLFGSGTFRNVGRQARPAPKPPPQPVKYPKARPEYTAGSRGACRKCSEQIPAGTMFIQWQDNATALPVYFHPECYPGERW